MLFNNNTGRFLDNKLPEVSIDEYMKNFDLNNTESNSSNLFDDDIFPTIPM